MPTFCNGTADDGSPFPTCYEDLLRTLWENLNLLSGIMGFLFFLQVVAASAACQLLCCAQKRNHFSQAAEAAVKKLGIVMETTHQDVKEDEVLLDSDYSSNSEDDDDIELGENETNEEYDTFNGDGLYDEPDDTSHGGVRSAEFNITQRSSGPDSSDEESTENGQRTRRLTKRSSPAPHDSDSDTNHNPRAATYAQEVIDVDIADDDSDADQSESV